MAAGEWTFTADTENQKSLADALGKAAGDFYSKVGEMYSVIQGMSSSWEGEDYKLFSEGADGYKVALAGLRDSIYVYQTHFNSVIEGTEQLALDLKEIIENLVGKEYVTTNADAEDKTGPDSELLDSPEAEISNQEEGKAEDIETKEMPITASKNGQYYIKTDAEGNIVGYCLNEDGSGDLGLYEPICTEDGRILKSNEYGIGMYEDENGLHVIRKNEDGTIAEYVPNTGLNQDENVKEIVAPEPVPQEEIAQEEITQGKISQEVDKPEITITYNSGDLVKFDENSSGHFYCAFAKPNGEKFNVYADNRGELFYQNDNGEKIYLESSTGQRVSTNYFTNKSTYPNAEFDLSGNNGIVEIEGTIFSSEDIITQITYQGVDKDLPSIIENGEEYFNYTRESTYDGTKLTSYSTISDGNVANGNYYIKAMDLKSFNNATEYSKVSHQDIVISVPQGIQVKWSYGGTNQRFKNKSGAMYFKYDHNKGLWYKCDEYGTTQGEGYLPGGFVYGSWE